MMDGSIVVGGNSGSSTGASMRGGLVVVKGDAGARSAIAGKGGTLVIGGSTGYMSGFMNQRTRLVVCGDAGPGFGDSMYEGSSTAAADIAELGSDTRLRATVRRGAGLAGRRCAASTAWRLRGEWKKCALGREAVALRQEGVLDLEGRAVIEHPPRPSHVWSAGDAGRHPPEGRARALRDGRLLDHPPGAQLRRPHLHPVHALAGAAGGLPRALPDAHRAGQARRREPGRAGDADRDLGHELRGAVGEREGGAGPGGRRRSASPPPPATAACTRASGRRRRRSCTR